MFYPNQRHIKPFHVKTRHILMAIASESLLGSVSLVTAHADNTTDSSTSVVQTASESANDPQSPTQTLTATHSTPVSTSTEEQPANSGATTGSPESTGPGSQPETPAPNEDSESAGTGAQPQAPAPTKGPEPAGNNSHSQTIVSDKNPGPTSTDPKAPAPAPTPNQESASPASQFQAPSPLAASLPSVTTPPDDQIVNIPDPVLFAAVKSAFRINSDTITIGQIRKFDSRQIDINTRGGAVKDLTGLEALQYASTNFPIDLTFTLAGDTVNDSKLFAPLQSLNNISILSIRDPHFGSLSDEALMGLTAMPAGIIGDVELLGDLENSSFDGLSNRQLGLLASWLLKIVDNHVAPINYKSINLSNNSISNFSPLAPMSLNGYGPQDQIVLYAANELIKDSNQLSATAGTPLTIFNAGPIGLQGETVNLTNPYMISDADELHYVPITTLTDTDIQIDNPQPLSTPGLSPYIIYGQRRNYYTLEDRSDKVYTTGSQTGIELRYNGRFYQKVNWQDKTVTPPDTPDPTPTPVDPKPDNPEPENPETPDTGSVGDTVKHLVDPVVTAPAKADPAAQTQPRTDQQDAEVAHLSNGGSAATIDESPDEAAAPTKTKQAATKQKTTKTKMHLQKTATVAHHTRTSQTSSQATLPQTNDRSTTALTILGLIGLTSLAWLGRAMIKPR